jgi:hypothetical protein
VVDHAAIGGELLLFCYISSGLWDGEATSGRAFIHPLRMQLLFPDLRYLAANVECSVDLNE